jgi:lysine 2,3-aminomutase
MPFGITPYYASLMDDEPSKNDSAIRAQVLPPVDYVEKMLMNRSTRQHSFDYMLEADTSPIELITRRYPGIVILKPVSTCPQICVYCQRNWEIDQVMAPRSFANKADINSAIKWLKSHPAIREVLVTGGDPFIMSDNNLKSLLISLAEIPHIDLIRIGTRTLVTLPMRITDRFAEMLGSFRKVGKRDLAIVTHIEHPYEVTPETAIAVDKLKRQGICVYNQQVYTFYVSRRFETTLLRILLRRIGIDPYYTFMPKGKEETNDYRVPISRILQEQKEEARLVPGLRRTDEAVFNIPGLGKNYLRAVQHRDLLTVLPDGKRVYEFHPWEINLVSSYTYLHKDVAILDYLRKLADAGENPEDYDSIWFYI